MPDGTNVDVFTGVQTVKINGFGPIKNKEGADDGIF
jgi:hypothetical protein